MKAIDFSGRSRCGAHPTAEGVGFPPEAIPLSPWMPSRTVGGGDLISLAHSGNDTPAGVIFQLHPVDSKIRP